MSYDKPSTPRYHIQLLYGNGGGGHKASALAVQKCLQSSPLSQYLHVELVDASFIAGATLGDWLYNVLLSYDLITAIEVVHSALHNVIFPLMRPSLRQAFRTHFSKYSPSSTLHCVVSFVPILNAIIAESLQPSIPLMTVFTDFSHTSGHPWIQHPRQHLLAGTDIAVAQSLTAGFSLPNHPSPSMHVTPTSGMVVHPTFYSALSCTAKRRRRVDLGLPPDLPTVLILFGGTPPTERVLKLVDLFLERNDFGITNNSNKQTTSTGQVNVIAICAKNRILFDRLTRRKRRESERRLFVTGFTTDIPLFMQVSDVLIGKPGPGVVSEAFVSNLPSVLVTGTSESQVMKQERDVLDWVRRHGVGSVAHNEEDASNVTQEQILGMRKRMAKMTPNRAVFEVRDLILSEFELDGAEHEVKKSEIVDDMIKEIDTEVEVSSGSGEEGGLDDDVESVTEGESETMIFSKGIHGLMHVLESQPIKLDFRKSGLIHSSVVKGGTMDGSDVEDGDDCIGQFKYGEV